MSNPQERSARTPAGSQPAQPVEPGTGQAGQGTTTGARATGTTTGATGAAGTEGAGQTQRTGSTTTTTRDDMTAGGGQRGEAAGYPAGYDQAADENEPGTASTVGGVLSVVAGLLTFFAGLALVVRTSFYPTLSGYAYQWSAHNWGWALVGLGILLFAVGACALLGMAWARAAGIGIAVLTAIAGFLFLPFTPIWGIIIVALSVFTIWGMAHDSNTSRAY